MSEKCEVSGMVLSASPIGENDKRVVLLTRELGKISAFSRGARRQGSTLMAASNPFVTGSFFLVPGRNSYTLIGADVREYFTEMAYEQPGIFYGYYFLDFTSYYGREGMDGTDMLNLLYLSVKALLNPHLEDALVRRIFEMRLMTINGEFSAEAEPFSPEARYVAEYITRAPLSKLYTFTTDEAVLKELGKVLDRHMARIMDRPLRSRKVLEEMLTAAK